MARGISSRPSSVKVPPAPVISSTHDGIARDRPDLFEHVERGAVNAEDLVVGERQVAAAGKARPAGASEGAGFIARKALRAARPPARLRGDVSSFIAASVGHTDPPDPHHKRRGAAAAAGRGNRPGPRPTKAD